MGRLGQDLRYAARTALRAPSVAILAVLAFALGIGVTTAVFSIFNSVLLAPLPFPDPQELVAVYGTQPACATCPASFPEVQRLEDAEPGLRRDGRLDAGVVRADRDGQRRAGERPVDDRVAERRVPRPAAARALVHRSRRIRPGGPKVVVLAYKFWQRRFSGDPSVVGRKLIFDGEPYEVIGVMPVTFTHRGGDFYVPLQRKLDPAHARQPLPGDLRAAEAGRPAGSRDDGDARAGAGAREGIRPQPRHRRAVLP